ncbi:MAG: hypothetical protein D6740_09860 [Alphaproteobacteria bacterium]|nr:MAG: hypothetical protein D6740_09860 [Alphaproteobacteria bacterium]
MGRNVHFELQGLRGNSWTVIEIFDDQNAAVRAAEKAFRTTTFTAVRVLRERFNPKDGQFHSFEVLYKGRKIRTSKFDVIKPTAGCEKVSDLYSTDGRQQIGELLRDSLDDWQLTPLEILYGYDNYLRLSQAGTTLQGAVQRAAVAQVKMTGEAVGERVKKLYSLIDEAAAALKALSEAGFPVIDEERFASLLAGLEGEKERGFLLCGAIAQDLARCRTGVEKLRRLLGLMRENHPAWASRIIDHYIAEILALRGVLDEVLGTRAAVERIFAIATLLGSGPGHGRAPTGLAARLARFMEARLLRQSRRVLERQLVEAIGQQRRWTQGSLIEEFRAIARVAQELGGNLQMEGAGAGLVQQLEERAARFLNSQTIASYLETCKTPAERLAALLDLEPFVLGADNKRMLANYMLPQLTGPDEAFWLKDEDSPARAMKRLADFQQRVLSSTLTRFTRDQLADRLDALCVILLEKAKIFDKLRASRMPPYDAVMRIFALIEQGLLTEGRAQQLAVEEARRYMRSKGFVQQLAALPDEQERKRRLDALQRKLARFVPAAETSAAEATNDEAGRG